jgi:hypothetical protein
MVNNQRNAVSRLVTGFCRRSKRFCDTHERRCTAGDGETRIIGVGEIILIEDVHGKGHLQAVGQMRRSVLIPID